MKWMAYYYSINRDEIKEFNIFGHWRFREDVQKPAKKRIKKEDFKEKLRRELLYYFWSKCEWELVIEVTEDNHIFLKPWCGCREPDKVRVDVTNDDSFDWKGFAEKHISQQIFNNEAKIDVYDQIRYVWEDFAEYVWKNRKELLKEGEEDE